MNNSCDGVSEKAMLLNKIVNHDLCFVCEQVRAIFSSIHGELRFGPPGRDRLAAWGVLQLTSTLERPAPPPRSSSTPAYPATLIQFDQKTSVFLHEATRQFQATIIARPFEQIDAPPVDFITCRALDRFMQKLPALIDWAPEHSKLLLFGGETLREELRQANLNFDQC